MMSNDQWRTRAKRIIVAAKKRAQMQAEIWAASVSLVVEHPYLPDEGVNPDLAKHIEEVMTLRIAAEIACEEAGIDLRELLKIIRESKPSNK